jgi:nicotinamidase-related amidase
MTEIIIPHPEKKRALILVDIQEGFLNDDNRWIIPNIKNIINEGGYSLTVEAVFHADPDSLWDKQIKWLFPMQPTIPEIKLLLNSSTITTTKISRSAFKGDKNLVNIFKQNSIEEVHIVGLDTNDCVFATAQESFDLGFFTYVLEECTAASEGEEYREAAIKILRHLRMTNHTRTCAGREWITPHDFESCASTNSAIPA